MTEPFGTLPDAPHAAPQLSAAAPVTSRPSPLDELRSEAQKDIDRLVEYEVSTRPGYRLQFRTVIDAEDVRRYQRAAQGKRKKAEDADPILQAGMPLAEYNTAILKDGVAIVGSDGEDLTINSSEFIGMMGVSTAVQAAQKFLGDGLLLSMGNALFREAGYGEDLTPLDPTES